MDDNQESSLHLEYIQSADSRELMERIYRIHGDYLMKMITNKFRVSADHDDVCDCFNYVFLHLADKECRRIRMFQGRASFKTYFVSVCRNLIVDFLEEHNEHIDMYYVEQEQLEMTPDVYNGINVTPERALIEKENREVEEYLLKEVNRSMKKLTDHERLVIKLRLQKRTYDEINRMTGDKNSAYTLKRAYEKLKNFMGEDPEKMFSTIIEE